MTGTGREPLSLRNPTWPSQRSCLTATRGRPQASRPAGICVRRRFQRPERTPPGRWHRLATLPGPGISVRRQPASGTDGLFLDSTLNPCIESIGYRPFALRIARNFTTKRARNVAVPAEIRDGPVRGRQAVRMPGAHALASRHGRHGSRGEALRHGDARRPDTLRIARNITTWSVAVCSEPQGRWTSGGVAAIPATSAPASAQMGADDPTMAIGQLHYESRGTSLRAQGQSVVTFSDGEPQAGLAPFQPRARPHRPRCPAERIQGNVRPGSSPRRRRPTSE